MDIWAWVTKKEEKLYQDGHERLANIMSDISSFTCDDLHDKVDQILPEGLALARQMGDKWVELFLRHWNLQSRVRHRYIAGDILSEAVDLLDFAHQDDTRDCPQRICVVQDLASCYGVQDGPGFVDERLQVTQETLDQINGNWPCYVCIGSEYCSALLDAGRYQEALDALQRFYQELARCSQPRTHGDFSLTKTTALLRLGRLEEAMDAIVNAEDRASGESFLRNKQFLIALILALQGQYEKAVAACPPIDAIRPSPCYYDDWCEVYYVVLNAGALEIDYKLIDQFQVFARTLAGNGAYRKAFLNYSRLARLGLQYEYFFTAKVAVEEMRRLLPRLNKDLGASAELQALSDQLDAQREKWDLPIDNDSPDAFASAEFKNAEQQAFAYEKAHRRWPTDVNILVKLGDIYENFFQTYKTERLLTDAYNANPNHQELQYSYGAYLLNHKGREAFFKEFDRIDIDSLDESQKANLLWLYTFAFSRLDNEKSLAYLKRFLEIYPEHRRALVMYANRSTELEKYDEAISCWNKLIELEPDEKDHHWDRLVPATITAQWKLVRESAAVLGFELSGSDAEPVNQELGYIRIQFFNDQGDKENFSAVRTGPVSARIINVKSYGRPQRYGHEVVFYPTALNTLSEKDDEGYACDADGHYTYIYPIAKTLSAPALFAFALDGVHPGDSILQSLQERLDEHGCVFTQFNTEEYRVYPRDEQPDNSSEEQNQDVDLPGLYAVILVPENGDLGLIHSLLQDTLAAAEHPMIWPRLLEQLGRADLLQQQLQIEQLYNLN